MKKITGVLIATAICASFFARQAAADIVFEEITSQSGMPTGGSGGKTKVLISGDKYRAQKKMTMDVGAMGDQMKFSQQMSGGTMGAMNKIMRAGKPDYPDHIMTLDEWAEFDENAKLIDEVSRNMKKGKGLFGKLKKDLKADFGGNKKKETTIDDVIGKYCQEFDSGLLEKKKDEMAEKLSQEGGMGIMTLAQVTDYDTWLRAKIIRGSCGGSGQEDREYMEAARGTASKLGTVSNKPAASGNPLETVRKISDEKTPEYQEQKRQFELNSKYKAEYAKGREKSKEMSGTTDKMMKESMAGMADAVNDMMLNVQIIRLDTGKVFELFPPKNPKDPKPSDLTYKEQTLDDVREKTEEQEKKMQKMMKDSEGARKAGEAQMAAARAKYGDAAIDQATGGKPQAKKIGNETVNGIACEHWQVKGTSGLDDYWVSNKFAGAEEIMAFEAKLKEKTGAGRGGIAFGGMPDMSSMMSGTDPVMAAEVAKIKARGIVIKKVNTMKNAAPSQASMLHNHKMASADAGDAGAAQMAKTNAAMAGMSDKQKAAMMQDPAAFQKMMGGNNMGESMQASAEKRQAAGDYKTDDRQDMVNTYELKLVGTNPVPDAAFEVPAGAKRTK